MKKICFNSKYFNVKDTLFCGQVFRFRAFKNGYLVISGARAAYLYENPGKTFIECEDKDCEYFSRYFDLDTDYSKITSLLIKNEEEIIKKAVSLGEGIRILNQEVEETLFSFIISQNNNIPRIKSSIEKLSENFGEKFTFYGQEIFAFPRAEKLRFPLPITFVIPKLRWCVLAPDIFGAQSLDQ